MSARSGEPDGPPPRPELLAALHRREAAPGFVPTDRFMDVALYAPDVGYYARADSPFGPKGDFYTAPSVHPIFARTVARRVAEVERALGGTHPFSVVDLGCGDGTLLTGIARSLEASRPGRPVLYRAVDRSEPRREKALAGLRNLLAADDTRAAAPGSLAELGPVEGVVIAHELLDAQPASRWRWDGQRWVELGVQLSGRQLVEVGAPDPREGDSPSCPLPPLGPDDVGTVAETSVAAEALVREVADHLTAGLLLVIDFGAEGSELLAGHPRGTLAAVRSHRAAVSPWERPGEVDLSTFVNFSRVRSAARRAGLVEVGYRPQAEALGAWGFASELEQAIGACRSTEEEVRTRLAAKNLLFGFGTFRALELSPTGSARRLGVSSAPSEPARS